MMMHGLANFKFKINIKGFHCSCSQHHGINCISSHNVDYEPSKISRSETLIHDLYKHL